MTKEEILAMEAGRDLDALIEEKLFSHQVEWRYFNWLPEGWYEVQSYYDLNLPSDGQYSGGLLDEDKLHPCYRDGEKWTVVSFYSTDISASWLVVGELSKLRLGLELEVIPGDNQVAYYCNIYPSEIGGKTPQAKQTGKINGNSMPEAICKAALLAKRYGIKVKRLEEREDD